MHKKTDIWPDQHKKIGKTFAFADDVISEYYFGICTAPAIYRKLVYYRSYTNEELKGRLIVGVSQI